MKRKAGAGVRALRSSNSMPSPCRNVSLPEEPRKILDTKIGMNTIGDMGATRSTRPLTRDSRWRQNEGGPAGIGAGPGAGVSASVAVAGAMAGAMTSGGCGAAAPAACCSLAAAVTPWRQRQRR